MQQTQEIWNPVRENLGLGDLCKILLFSRAPLEQLHNQTVVVDNVTCYGLAVDWVHDVLYWTDREQKTLEAAYLDGSKRRTVFKNLDQPKDIAVDPHKK